MTDISNMISEDLVDAFGYANFPEEGSFNTEINEPLEILKKELLRRLEFYELCRDPSKGEFVHVDSNYKGNGSKLRPFLTIDEAMKKDAKPE